MSEPVGPGPEWPADQNYEVALQPQRIRLFRVIYNSTDLDKKSQSQETADGINFVQ